MRFARHSSKMNLETNILLINLSLYVCQFLLDNSAVIAMNGGSKQIWLRIHFRGFNKSFRRKHIKNCKICRQRNTKFNRVFRFRWFKQNCICNHFDCILCYFIIQLIRCARSYYNYALHILLYYINDIPSFNKMQLSAEKREKNQDKIIPCLYWEFGPLQHFIACVEISVDSNWIFCVHLL